MPMPIYEFKCPGCGTEVSKLMKMSDPIPECSNCLECGKNQTMAKKVSASGFKLAGGGWYKDGY